MYYLYFPYVIILSLLMLIECVNKNRPKWWIPTVLIAPVTAPYFIFKSRKETGMIFFMIFLTSFAAVAAGEIYLYSKYVKKNRYAHLPPETRQMIRLSEKLKATTHEFDSDLIRLENLSKVESRVHEIKNTIEFIGALRSIMAENKQDIDRLIKYTSDYKQFFKGRDLQWVFHVQKFYNNRNVIQHYKSLNKYLNSFEELLKYTYVNFYNITDHKSPEHLKNYDEYYLRYRRAVDSHNRFNVKRIEFQNAFLEKYPDVKAYLPGERQTDTFRLWE